jgi:cell division protein FtsI/penicillin-binding protein 2
LAACALVSGWWVFVRGDALLNRTDNQRRYIADRYVRRGAILDRDNRPIVESTGAAGEYARQMLYPDLSNLVGYTNAAFGQAGLEAGLDEYLRGLRSAPPLEVWWNRVLYSQPPPGQDVRLTLDLDLQRQADAALGERRAALVAMNARSGEILAMASHPTYDANRLDEQHSALLNDPGAPLFNRAVQGRYPLGDLARLFPAETGALWVDPLPALRLPTDQIPDLAVVTGGDGAAIPAYSPLQLAIAAATFSNGGMQPEPQLVAAVRTKTSGWTPLQPATAPQPVLTSEQVQQMLTDYTVEATAGQSIWLAHSITPASVGQASAWAAAGTLPGWNGPPYIVVVFLDEDEDEMTAAQIAADFLNELMK